MAYEINVWMWQKPIKAAKGDEIVGLLRENSEDN